MTDRSPQRHRQRHPQLATIGDGRYSAVICLLMGGLGLLSVLAFLFPSYLTTPDLRAIYDPNLLRTLLGLGLFIGTAFGCFALYRQAGRRIAWSGMGLIALALLLGGPSVKTGPILDGAPYLGLDWFIIGLLTSGGLFIALERLAPFRAEQSVFRAGWLHDIKHFALNHCLIGFYLLIANLIVHDYLGWMIVPMVGAFIADLPFIVQFFGLLLAVDMLVYGVHRLYHTTDFFWKIHSVHHSTDVMDWLAGSRFNFLEPIITRTAGLLVITTLGFEPGPISAYIVFASFHATWLHANLGWDLRWMERIGLCTPKFHHWHHAKAEAAINMNYGTYVVWFDRLFGSYYNPDTFPDGYGVLHDPPPKSLWAQQLHPFVDDAKSVLQEIKSDP